MMDQKYLAEIKAREQEATPGPWVVEDTRDYAEINVPGSHELDFPPVAISNADYNAAFIAHARADVPALVAEVERLTDQHRCDVHNVKATQATLNQQAKNCENLLASKDQQIAALEKKVEELRGYMHHFGDECVRLAEHQAQEQEGKK